MSPLVGRGKEFVPNVFDIPGSVAGVLILALWGQSWVSPALAFGFSLLMWECTWLLFRFACELLL